MRLQLTGIFALLLMLCVSSRAQSSQNPPSSGSSASSQPQTATAVPGVHRARQTVPCWKQAGIAAAMVNEKWKIEDRAKTRISAVCSDDSLGAEQKNDKIRQIDEQRDDEIEKLIPAKQFAAFRSCQAALDKKRGAIPTGKQSGPCGGAIPSEPGTKAPSH